MFTSRTIGNKVSRPVSWSDKISIEKIRDGSTNTFLFGEAHKLVDALNKFKNNTVELIVDEKKTK